MNTIFLNGIQVNRHYSQRRNVTRAAYLVFAMFLVLSGNNLGVYTRIANSYTLICPGDHR
jgi:hypothetical protein